MTKRPHSPKTQEASKVSKALLLLDDETAPHATEKEADTSTAKQVPKLDKFVDVCKKLTDHFNSKEKTQLLLDKELSPEQSKQARSKDIYTELGSQQIASWPEISTFFVLFDI